MISTSHSTCITRSLEPAENMQEYHAITTFNQHLADYLKHHCSIYAYAWWLLTLMASSSLHEETISITLPIHNAWELQQKKVGSCKSEELDHANQKSQNEKEISRNWNSMWMRDGRALLVVTKCFIVRARWCSPVRSTCSMNCSEGVRPIETGGKMAPVGILGPRGRDRG